MSHTPIEKIVQSSDGTAIWAEAVGDPSKPSILFAHGLWLSAGVFDDVFRDERLLDNAYLVRYDMRGHGRSGKPAEEAYTSALLADDYAAVLRAFNLQRPLHVGWSYGAAIATDVCANISPPPMSGLVFLSSLPSVAPEVLFTVATPTVVGLQPGLNTTSDAALYAQTKIDLIDSLFADPDNVPFALKTSLIGQSVMQRAALGGVLLSRAQDPAKLFEAGKAGMPLLILHGTGDKIMSGDGAVEALTPHFSDMDVRMYEGAGHALFHDKQDEVITEILVFLKRIGEKTKRCSSMREYSS